MAGELVPQSTKTAIAAYFSRALERERADQVGDQAGFRKGIARKRFREGLTNEDQFAMELRALFTPENEIPLELVAGRLDYAYDYTMDLVAAWRDAVRKGNIDIDLYGEFLSSVGIVPERVGGYMLREVARQKPEEAPTAVAPPVAEYLTDAGKIKVDTIRRERRKLLITRDEEVAALTRLGMPTLEAESMADNDDVRLAEKGNEGPS